MSPTAIALVLVAAIAHASWNLFSKQAAAAGAAYFIWLFSACVTVGYAPVAALAVLLGDARLTGLNWLFMVGTGVLQAAYFLFLQAGYALGDLSVVYPVGRGTGATLAAIGGIVLLGERPTALTAAGITAIVGGVVAIGLPGRAGPAGQATAGSRTARPGATGPAARRPAATPPAPARAAPAATPPAPARAAPAATPSAPAAHTATRPPGTAATRPAAARGGPPAPRAVAFALATGAFIASYTIWDKYAVANLHTQAILQGYACFPVMAAAFSPYVLRDRGRLTEVWRSFRPQVLGAALLAPLAYILVLTALSFTAVSAVAPAREVSVLFGVLLGRRLLGEGSLARRLCAATAIVAGIIAIAIG